MFGRPRPLQHRIGRGIGGTVEHPHHPQLADERIDRRLRIERFWQRLHIALVCNLQNPLEEVIRISETGKLLHQLSKRCQLRMGCERRAHRGLPRHHPLAGLRFSIGHPRGMARAAIRRAAGGVGHLPHARRRRRHRAHVVGRR